MSEPIQKDLNQHRSKDALDWTFNMMIQPASGEGSGVGGATKEHFKMSMELVKQAITVGFEHLGYGGRDLRVVFGTPTVADTFAAVRAEILTNGFVNLRYGDYVDLETYTVSDFSNRGNVTVSKNATYQSTRMEIAAFNQFLNIYGTLTTPHAVFLSKQVPLLGRMHSSNDNSLGYGGVEMFSELPKILTAIQPQLGSTVPYEFSRYLNTYNSDQRVQERVFIPSVWNIYGRPGNSFNKRGTERMFGLYALAPERSIKFYNGSRYSYWLAEPSGDSSLYFCLVNDFGYLNNRYASNTYGVPFGFLI